MHNEKLAFIGAGNMATAIIGGLIASGYEAQKIWATSPNSEQLACLSKQFAIHTTTNNQEAAEKADVIIME